MADEYLMAIYKNLSTADPNDFCMASTTYTDKSKVISNLLPRVAEGDLWSKEEFDAGHYAIMTHAEWTAELKKMDVDGVTATTFIDALDIKSFDPFTLEWNLTRAKTIQKERIREERQPKFAELDIEFQRALESESDTTAIVAKKKELRDLTAAVDIAKNIKEIKEAWHADMQKYSELWE